jgi:predicted dithiol-disulfide oxidoreductase (DUF899 family)
VRAARPPPSGAAYGDRARDPAPELVDGRDSGLISCYVRDADGQVFETYWTTGRGAEALMTSYHALDLTMFGRQERWGLAPRLASSSGRRAPGRAGGRPTAQWARIRRVQPNA